MALDRFHVSQTRVLFGNIVLGGRCVVIPEGLTGSWGALLFLRLCLDLFDLVRSSLISLIDARAHEGV